MKYLHQGYSLYTNLRLELVEVSPITFLAHINHSGIPPRQRSLVARRLVRHARWQADPQISPRKRWSDKMRERKRGKIIGWWIISVGAGVTGGQSVFVSIQGSPGTLISVSFQYPSSTPPATYTSYKYLLKPHEARLRAYTCVSIQTRSFF